MAIIANLDVNLGVVTDKFRKGLGQAKQSVQGFTGRMRRLGGVITKGLNAFGIFGLAAQGLQSALAPMLQTVRVLTSEFGRIDQIAKTSEKLGIATEQFTTLAGAVAEFSGIGEQQFGTALQRMTRRLSEAAMGTGEARGAIRELGLDAKALAKATPDEAFRAIADAFTRVTSQGDRVRLAFKLFDTEGVALVNTLSKGSAAIQATQDDLAKLGITFTELDADKVERVNDAFGRLRSLGTAILRRFAIALAPHIEAITQQLIHMGRVFIEGLNRAKPFFDFMLKILRVAINLSNTVIGSVGAVARLLGVELKPFTAATAPTQPAAIPAKFATQANAPQANPITRQQLQVMNRMANTMALMNDNIVNIGVARGQL